MVGQKLASNQGTSTVELQSWSRKYPTNQWKIVGNETWSMKRCLFQHASRWINCVELTVDFQQSGITIIHDYMMCCRVGS